MTSKQRILRVFRGGIPDRVPVSAGISEMIPVRFSGRSYLDVFHFAPVPLWKLRVDAERLFGFDAFIHVFMGLRPEFRNVEKIMIREDEREVVYREIYHTEQGDLQKVVRISHPEGCGTLEPLVKSPADLRLAMSLYREPSCYDFDEYMRAYDYLGEDGTMAPCITCPADELSDLFGGPQQFIYAHFDEPDLLREFTGHYTEYVLALLKEFVRRAVPMDVIQIGAAILSESVTSQAFFKTYMTDFLRKLLAYENEHPDQVILQQHTCGKSRTVLEQSFALGLKAFEPIEEAPMGDVDLQEVKNKFGDRMVLKGNINSITTMLQGTPDQIRQEAREKLRIGMPGGRFFLAVGDQTPYHTPEANIRALVESGHEFGCYH